jgi:sugar O-acyltransferase (sialic acid O-acetyltransferase NeuD family)
MTPIILLGKGGHALACLDVLQTIQKLNVIGYVDSVGSEGGEWEGLPYLGTDEDLPELIKKCPQVLLGIGQIKNPDLRRKLVQKLRTMNAIFPVVISPKAHVAKGSKIAEGTIVMHGAHVGPGSSIGSFNILNTQSLIEHGSNTGEFVHISTASVVNGDVKIGSNTFIGSNSVLCHGIEVPENSFVQAGEYIGNKYAW